MRVLFPAVYINCVQRLDTAGQSEWQRMNVSYLQEERGTPEILPSRRPALETASVCLFQTFWWKISTEEEGRARLSLGCQQEQKQNGIQVPGLTCALPLGKALIYLFDEV